MGIPEELTRVVDCTRAVDLYKGDLPHAVMITTEYSLWMRKWKECISAVPETLMEAVQEYSTFAYPNLNVLFHIALTLPLTSCENEQNFSQLKLIKTAQSATMMESRLSGLALMKVNRDRCNKLISKDRFRELVKSFTQQYQSRMKLSFMLTD